MMKIISIEKAVGKKISHDMTKITSSGKIKKIFPKGYIIKKKDIEKFKDMGKYEIIVLDKNNNKIHENEGSKILAKKASGNFCSIKESKEGKTSLIAQKSGLLKINTRFFKKLNLIEGIIASSKKNYTSVKKGEKISIFGIIPVEIKPYILEKALEFLKKPIVEVIPFLKQKIGLITTGTEIYSGRIKDSFFSYVSDNLNLFNFKLNKQIILPDNINFVKKSILKMIKDNFQIILLSGGMSVDANDITVKAIKQISKIKIINYGSPVLPGAMFLLAYFKDIPIIGLPAGLLKSKLTIFNFVLPFILARKKINKSYIANLSNGGLL